MKKVLQLFSGGKDSFLSSCLLVEQGYEVYLVTYDNGYSLNSKSSISGARRLVKKYGTEKVKILGVRDISGIWRELIVPYYNSNPSYILKQYGEIPISQFNCLTCRISMYIYSIILCQQLGIEYISDGARADQFFAVEQKEILNKFNKLLNEYDIKLLLPVIDLNSDWQRKNELLLRGFVPKTLEPQCLLGVPMNKSLDIKTIDGIINLYDKYIFEKLETIIDRYKKADLNNGEFF